MTAQVIDGKAIAARVTAEIAERVATRLATGRSWPGLAIVLVGENPASQVFVRNKREMIRAVGMRSFPHDLPATTSQQELLMLIDFLSADPAVRGILVQLPLPKQIDADIVSESIDRRKDVASRPVDRPCFIKGTWIKPGAVVIDAGVHRNAEGRLCGDVDFESARQRAAWITPVPGGVGPMTVAMLTANTLLATELQQ